MRSRHQVLCMLLCAWAALPVVAAESTDCIAVIGTGMVGGALGARLGNSGHRVVYGSRDAGATRVRELVAASGPAARATAPAAAAAACETLVFAVPWPVAETSLHALGELRGKVLIDTSNLIEMRDGKMVVLEVATSAAEQVQAWAPGARVVKAFNTMNFRTMAQPEAAGGPVTVMLSGDDPAAKAVVAALVSSLGFEPADVGPLKSARYTEQMALFYATYLRRSGRSYEFYLRPRP
jgi:predicted dinucleotide-binding enzyme